jgi:hypothetical protein
MKTVQCDEYVATQREHGDGHTAVNPRSRFESVYVLKMSAMLTIASAISMIRLF